MFVGEITVDRMSVDEMTIDEMTSFLHQDGSQGTWTKVNSIILHQLEQTLRLEAKWPTN